MDSARQVIRFGIPGAFAMLWGLSTFVVAGVLRGADVSTALAPISANVSTIVAVAGTVPIGWGCFQIYYALYGPLILGGHFVRRDRGFEVLEQLTPYQRALVRRLFPTDLQERAAPYDVASRFGWQKSLGIRVPYRTTRAFGLPTLKVLTIRPEDRGGYAQMWRIHWEIVCALLDLIAANDGTTLKQEYTHLSDVYHGIGAARIGMWLGFGAGLAAAAVHAGVDGLAFLPVLEAGLVMLVGCMGWGFSVLRRVRRRTWVSSRSVLGRGLRLYFASHPDVLRDAVTETERNGSPEEPHALTA